MAARPCSGWSKSKRRECKMKYHFSNWRVGVVFAGASLMAVPFLSSTPAPSQNGSARCVGCSVDGKTTPKTADGHPDLNGFWNTPTEQGAQQFQRSSDGS